MSRLRLLSGPRVNWHPLDVPRSLHGDWWSARDYGTALMTDDGDGLISSWKGRIAALDMTAAGAARPQYSATGFNGAHPALVGNGSSVAMGRESTSGLPTGTTPGFVAFVGGGFGPSDTVIAYGNSSAAGTRQIDTSSTPLLRGRASNVFVTTASAGGAPMVVLLICEAERLRMRVNGAETVLANVLGSIPTVRTRFFATTAGTPSAFAAGPISEALIGYAWPEQDYLRLEGWAAAEYGIALADGHPYAGTAP
jgi:hypothetical protein